MKLIELIPVGNKKRITSAEISKRLGISGAEVRKQINQLRTDGTAIASDSHGYYLTLDPTDLDHTIASFNSRISQMIKARSGLERAKRDMGA